MPTDVTIDYIFIIGFVCYMFIAFDKRRIRAPWAKFVFVICGLIGITKGVVGLMLDMRWLTLTQDAAYRVHEKLYFAGGLLLGFILSLILSGQLLGTKRLDRQADRETAA